MNAVFNDFFFRFVMVMTFSFSLFLFGNLTERGAMQLVFRTPTLTSTRTPTGVVRGCFSLFVIVRKPLKNLRFWLSLIQENIPIFSSSPVATTMRTLVNQGFFLYAHTQIPKPHPNDTQLSRFRGQVADEGLHPVGAFATHGRRHVSVAIQGECRGVMPHVFLQGFDVIPRHDAVHRKGVTQVVEGAHAS